MPLLLLLHLLIRVVPDGELAILSGLFLILAARVLVHP